MIINEETVKGKWLEIKGEVQKTWGKLTDDELTQTKGDLKAIAGIVQKRYGEDKDSFDKKFSEIMSSLDKKKNAAISDVKKDLKH